MIRDDSSIIDQARFIFATGRMIPEQILKIRNRNTSANGPLITGEISMAQLHAIHTVRLNGPLAMGVLAEKLGISAPSASAMVDRLVEKGILCRKHCTKDRRRVVVSISPAAVSGIEQAEEEILNVFIQVVKKLGPETVKKWCEVLTAVQAVLNDDDNFLDESPTSATGTDD